jgi:protein phosphatase 1 regulatory subunit 12A
MIDHCRYLIEHGASLSAVNSEGELPIDLADGDDMEELISDEMDKQGSSSISHKKGHYMILFCFYLVDIDAEAARNEEEEIMLKDANQWLNSKYAETAHPKTGATALHVASAKGYINVMKILIQAGADVDVTDFDGWTHLHASAHWGQEEACKVLVQNLCNMEARNQAVSVTEPLFVRFHWFYKLQGQTAIDIADSDVEPLLEQLKKEQASVCLNPSLIFCVCV